MERDVENFHINDVAVSFRDEPEVMRKDYSCYDVDGVMAAKTNHKGDLHKHSHNAEISELDPAIGLILTEAYHTAPDMSGIEEVICLSVGYCKRKQPREVP